MKKLLILAAFAGMFSTAAVAGNYGDDKDAKKKECKKSEKSCAGEKSACSKDAAGSCCKKKAEAKGEKKAEAKTTEKKS